MNAAYFSASIKKALEDLLGRRVTFAKVYYRILPIPGFSLEDVTINDDPAFGFEPFASRCNLEARLRIDKLLTGQIRVASLRIQDPSLNLVRREDGVWNIVEFLQRMTAPRRTPLNLVPTVQISNGRLDFKLGVRKTVFYISDADISIYPEHSGQVDFNFSGSPARTDRAGNGFGSLRGTLNWLVNPPPNRPNRIEADVTLLPSDLSEITTLIEGHDIGVHGTLSSHSRISGPLNALKVTGDLRLQNVHRWDLLPASGGDWRVPYAGDIDLNAQTLDLKTLPPSAGEAPAAVELKVADLLAKPAWTLNTTLNKVPVESVLPLARKMGFAVPAAVALNGEMDGTVAYSNSAGFSGDVTLHDATAKLPQIAPIAAAAADVKIVPDGLHLEPATLRETGGGTMQVGGDYSWATQQLAASISVNGVSIGTLKNTAQAWFGAPPALAAFGDGKDGIMTGELHYDSGLPNAQTHQPALDSGWSGQFQFTDATLSAVGLAAPLKKAQGRVAFTPGSLDMTRFSAQLDRRQVQGSYRFSATAKRQERVHLEVAELELGQLLSLLEPAWHEPGLLARLPFSNRSIPEWLAKRDLEGDLAVTHFQFNKNDLGPLTSRFVWHGSQVELTSLQLHAPDATLNGSGAIDLKNPTPRAHFKGAIAGFHWGGGSVDAEGEVESSGLSVDSLKSLHAAGSFSGSDLSLSLNEDFEKVSGTFELSFDGGWPKLRLSKLRAQRRDENWNGEALSNSDGQLVFDLGNGDRQLHIVGILAPPPAAAGSSDKVARK